MSAAVTPVDRVTVVFIEGSRPALCCSHCGTEMTDDDPECPGCDSPVDWGASDVALRAWRAAHDQRPIEGRERGAGGTAPGPSSNLHDRGARA